MLFVTVGAQTPMILKQGGADSQECMEWVEARLKKMTLKEKLGQLTMVIGGFQSYEYLNGKFVLKQYAVDHMKQYGIPSL